MKFLKVKVIRDDNHENLEKNFNNLKIDVNKFKGYELFYKYGSPGVIVFYEEEI